MAREMTTEAHRETVGAAEPAPRDGSVYRYFRQFHRSLGIHTTLACPLECAHCFIESSPRRTEALDHDMMVRRMQEIAQAGRIKLVILSGGEPLLARRTVQRILQIAERHGIAVSANTSAYFAASEAQAVRFLRRFPGLTHLAVSADQYHLAFTPLDHVRNALLAALRLDMHATLMLRVWDLDDDPFLHQARAAIGDDLMGRISIDLAQLHAHGRGRDLSVPPAARSVEVAEWPAAACDLAHHPVIDHDGEVLACCAYLIARKHAPLQLGNLHRQSLEEITADAERNNLLQAIRVWGPRRLAEILVENGLGDRLKGRYPKDDICALCGDIVSQPDLIAVLREALDRPDMRAELAIARMLRYGEVQPDMPAETASALATQALP